MKLTRFAKTVLIATSCLTLSACMNPQQRYSQDYNAAEKNFAAANYQSAFQKVQTPAKAGDANAQYALGYMYYYGRGTVANPKMAQYWFQQAAKKGQTNAQQALQMMQQQSVANPNQGQ